MGRIPTLPFPTAIIAGVPKAGTTALFNTLASQSRVSASTVKETNYFIPARYGEPLLPPSHYASYFRYGADVDAVVEATPNYFHGGQRTAAAVQALLPEVKIVVLLREPGARAFSWWRFCRSALSIDPNLSFSAYIRRCASLDEDPEASHSLVGFRGLSGGIYSRDLLIWRKTFDNRLLVVFYEDLQERPNALLEQVADHIGLKLDSHTVMRRHNITVDISNRSLHRVASKLNMAGERVWRRHPLLKSGVRAAYYAVNARKQQDRMDESDRRWLDDYYSDEIKKLHSLFSQSSRLPLWLRRA
jgi:hypothetical protein